MPSPFPGMNPYFENSDVWHGFHEWFCPQFARALVVATSKRYIVRIDENVYLHELSADGQRLIWRPDAAVFDTQPKQPSRSNQAPTLTAPAYVNLPAVDLERLNYIELRDGTDKRLLTVIELLSPANKHPGPDRDQYIAKRAKLLKQGVSLVEIDLLRGEPRMPMEGAPKSDYLVLVARSGEEPRAGIWPINLRDPLPEIPVPLASPDPDAVIALQPLIHAVYDAGGYDRFLYEVAPEPPLSAADAEWARGLTPVK